MARLLIYPKQQRYNVRYEKNWIFIEANQFFYYFYLSFHNQRGAPLRPAAAHVETENTGQADAEGSLTERNTENVKLLRGLRRTGCLARDEPLRCNRQTKGKRNTSIPVTRQDSLMPGTQL